MAYKKNVRVNISTTHRTKKFSSKHMKGYKQRPMMAILDIPTEREQRTKQALYERKREMLIAIAKISN